MDNVFPTSITGTMDWSGENKVLYVTVHADWENDHEVSKLFITSLENWIELMY